MHKSLHDHRIIEYRVKCEAREIVVVTRDEGQQRWITTFSDVVGYQFKDDALGNIIGELEEVPVESLLQEHGTQISEAYHRSGAPGTWAHSMDGAAAFLLSRGARAFTLSASMGMSGWVIAGAVHTLSS